MPQGSASAPDCQIFDLRILGREIHDETWELVLDDERRPMSLSAVPLGEDGSASVVVFQFHRDSAG